MSNRNLHFLFPVENIKKFCYNKYKEMKERIDMIMRYYLHVWDRYYNNESTFVTKANTTNEAQTIAEEEGELLAADHWDDGEADYDEEDVDEAELYDRYINDAVCYEIYQIKANITETVNELDEIARDEDPKFFIEEYCNPQPVAKDI